LSATEISSGWWQGEDIMGKFQDHSFQSLNKISEMTPFGWKGLDAGNGNELINDILHKFGTRWTDKGAERVTDYWRR